MSVDAIIMMLVAIATIWGGLTVAVVNLMRSPEEPIHADGSRRDT